MKSNSSLQINSAAHNAITSHISFEDMADYIFSDRRTENFMATAARINNHVMKCEQCRDLYYSLLAIQDEARVYAERTSLREKTLLKVIGYFYSIGISKPVEVLLDECRKFKLLLSFSIKSMRELSEYGAVGFAYPKLVTVMKSSNDDDNLEESESVIYSSLIDQNKNRVSIGLDGTLSLYFDAKEHSAGKRVMVIPDDENTAPQMIELTKYDNSLSFVRFEGVAPGQYTIVVEE